LTAISRGEPRSGTNAPAKGRLERTGRRPASLPSGRQALLEAAIRHFGLHGYQGVSLRALARDAGVDAALVSRLFGSKAGLWDAMLDDLVARRVSRFDRRLAQLQNTARPLADRVGEMVDLFVDIAAAVPDFLRLLLQDPKDGGGRIADAVEKLVQPVKAGMTPLIREGLIAGKLRGASPEMVFFVMTSAIGVGFGAPLFVAATLGAEEQLELPARLREAVRTAILAPDAEAPAAVRGGTCR
jgi:AcrR family transcriptional regulator